MREVYRFTSEDEQIIIEHYPTRKASEVAEMIGCSVRTCYRKAHELGVKKDPEWMRNKLIELGKQQMHKIQKYQFKKGQPSHNKGKKLPEETKRKMSKSWFKKGDRTHNEKYDGAESIRTDKNGNKYKFIRVSRGVWIPKHVYVWEQANGKVPKGHNIVFKDKNTMNIALENLEILSNAELMERNCYRNNYPPEVQELIHMKKRLTRHINKAIKRNGNSN